ncbi:MAG: hypothetical protein ACRDV4_08860, partial [Acidimicrobiales bacterium]
VQGRQPSLTRVRSAGRHDESGSHPCGRRMDLRRPVLAPTGSECTGHFGARMCPTGGADDLADAVVDESFSHRWL